MSKRSHDHAVCTSRRGISQRKCVDCHIPLGQVMYDRCHPCQSSFDAMVILSSRATDQRIAQIATDAWWAAHLAASPAR